MGAQVQQRALDELPTENPSAMSEGGSEADAARSQNNILRWKSYLPEDCVSTMVLMGWDLST